MRSTKIFSQRVDCVTLEQVFDEVISAVKARKRSLFFALNVHILLLLDKDKAFHSQHDQARVIFADGVPLVWLSNFTKAPLPARVSGTDLAEKILHNPKLKVFLLGSTEKTLKKIRQQFPNVSGFFVPSFSEKFSSAENRKIINSINRSETNVILVALGSLKQEKWLVDNLHKTTAFAGIGVGSALEILAGEKPRAPVFLRDNGFEWLWRIWLEPGRLTKRYLRDLYYLLLFLLKWGQNKKA